MKSLREIYIELNSVWKSQYFELKKCHAGSMMHILDSHN
jgi:hypothetical protein